MTLTEEAKDDIIEDIQALDFTFNSWDPNLQVWRAGEGYSSSLPYIVVDFVATSMKKFPSLGDVVGKVDDVRYEYAYCELELVNITVYANKYHNNGAIRGRDFAYNAATLIRTRILAFWNELVLSDYNASVERANDIPIRDQSVLQPDVETRIYELEMDVFLRTDVRWYKQYENDEVIEERAESAYGYTESNDNRINFRVIFNG